ncbi:MAG: type IV pilin protein [Acidobacteriota bacterium]
MNKILLQRKGELGFNLIELMIVMAIIGILLAVGITGYRVAIRSANETAAAQSLANIRTAQLNFNSKYKRFAQNFDELVEKMEFDDKFKGDKALVNGYEFTMVAAEPAPNSPAFYSVNADPQDQAGRHFYIDSTLTTIRVSDEERPARKDDKAL